MEQFELSLREAILTKKVQTNKDAYDFAIQHGHIGKHANDVIRELKKEKRIAFDDRSPKCNYNQVYKNKSIIKYHLL